MRHSQRYPTASFMAGAWSHVAPATVLQLLKLQTSTPVAELVGYHTAMIAKMGLYMYQAQAMLQLSTCLCHLLALGQQTYTNTSHQHARTSLPHLPHPPMTLVVLAGCKQQDAARCTALQAALLVITLVARLLVSRPPTHLQITYISNIPKLRNARHHTLCTPMSMHTRYTTMLYIYLLATLPNISVAAVRAHVQFSHLQLKHCTS